MNSSIHDIYAGMKKVETIIGRIRECIEFSHQCSLRSGRSFVVACSFSSWDERKKLRTARFWLDQYGWVNEKCVACNGSGRYDSHGSPPCGGCEGTRVTRKMGAKALKLRELLNESDSKDCG